jgi:hypothetical protein
MHLANVIPWGRSFDEYREMFRLTEMDLAGRVLGCGDGPASFNAQATAAGHWVISCDPLYRHSGRAIEARIRDSYPSMIAQVRARPERFRWSLFRDPDHLVEHRLATMQLFLADYETGKVAGRYVAAALPRLPFADRAFDLALCSHFLFLYSGQFDLSFHRAGLEELLRVAREVRAFPLVDLEGRASAHVGPIRESFAGSGCQVDIVHVGYEFQRGGNEMMRIVGPAA